MKLPDNDVLCTAEEMRKYLNVSVKQLQVLREAGMPTEGKLRNMRYPLTKCIRWYIEFCISEGISKVERRLPTGAEMDKDEAVARKLTAEALIKEVELEVLRGTLVNCTDAEMELSKHLGIVRQGLLSFPSRVAPYLVSLKNELDAREMMQNKVHDLMVQLSKAIEEAETIEEDEDEDDE